MAKRFTFDPEKAKNLDELCQDFSATQILYLLAETMLNEIDKDATIRYADCDDPHYFNFIMKNGREVGVVVMDILRD